MRNIYSRKDEIDAAEQAKEIAESSDQIQFATERGRRKAQKDAQKEALKQAEEARKKAAKKLRKFGKAMAKTAAAVVKTVAGCGGALAIAAILCVLLFVGSIVVTPLGILFSNETAAPGTIPLNAAIAQINAEFSTQLDLLLTQEHTSSEFHGQTPTWRDVVAVFACRGADEIVVAELNAERVEELRSVFWDMVSLTSEIVVVEVPAEESEDTEEDAEETTEEKILHIYITAKTASEMEAVYGFNEYQNEMLDVLLVELDGLNLLFGDLRILQEDAVALLNNLPEDLAPERRKVIENALKLVGKVNYFWGGKSCVLGWDSRWGTLMQVWAAGSSTTGTWRPFGLDCSGFVDWVFCNASDGEYLIGHGGGAATQHAYCTNITWSEAQPGDLVFYSDDSHVGIFGGWDESGNALIIHCTSGQYNNVVITDVGNFYWIARPIYYAEI